MPQVASSHVLIDLKPGPSMEVPTYCRVRRAGPTLIATSALTTETTTTAHNSDNIRLAGAPLSRRQIITCTYSLPHFSAENPGSPQSAPPTWRERLS